MYISNIYYKNFYFSEWEPSDGGRTKNMEVELREEAKPSSQVPTSKNSVRGQNSSLLSQNYGNSTRNSSVQGRFSFIFFPFNTINLKFLKAFKRKLIV